MTNAMNSWFCYKRFIFLLLLKTLLCNSTEVGTIANWKLCRLPRGALLSHRPSRVLTQKCFHRALRPRLPFDILQVMTMVNGECGEMCRGECSSRHTHPLQTFVLGKNCLFFFSFFSCCRVPPSVTTSVRISVSRCTRLSSRCSRVEQDFLHDCMNHKVWWSCVCGCSALSKIVTFTFGPLTFAHWSCFFVSFFFYVNPVPLRCWCIKSMFLVLSAIGVKLLVRSTAIRVQSSVSCIFLI